MVVRISGNQCAVLHRLHPVHDCRLPATLSSRQCRRIPDEPLKIKATMAIIRLATARARLAELRVTIRGHRLVQCQHLRHDDPIAHLVPAGPGDLDPERSRFGTVSGIRLFGLYRSLSRALGMAARAYYLVGRIREPAGMRGFHDFGGICHLLTRSAECRGHHHLNLVYIAGGGRISGRLATDVSGNDIPTRVVISHPKTTLRSTWPQTSASIGSFAGMEEVLAEFQAPLAYRLVADDEAPSGQQNIHVKE